MKRPAIAAPAVIFLSLVALSLSSQADAASPAVMCQAAKLNAVSRYARCRFRREALLAVTQDTERYGIKIARCGTVFRRSWRKVEAKYGGSCPQLDYRPAFDHVATQLTDGVALGLSGAVRFIDNGDGTITDTLLRVMWEKKNAEDGTADPANPSDVDNVYDWDTAVGTWIIQLNSLAPAGHDDWRVPAWSELKSINSALTAGCESSGSCIDPIFGPTVTLSASGYWSSTESDDPSIAGHIAFNSFTDSYFTGLTKTVPQHVRAVRNLP
jgi:hypothetical protein